MPELRWILLGLGVLFCLGLWWWESRRGRQAANSRASLKPTEGLTETTVVREALRHASIETPDSDELPPWNAPADEEAPPVEELDVEIELESVPLPPVDRDVRGPISAGLGRIEPIFGDPSSVVGSPPPDAPAPGPVPSAAPPASPRAPPPPRPPPAEKIVTLRVSAPPLERFEGSTLAHALEAAGLEHGRMSIFHKITSEGATLFSAASLVEPGTFDLATIAGKRFPGVSLFAVLRSDGDAGAVLEEMVETARSLASALHGMVQDERGALLSPQRLAELRAEVFAWAREHSGVDGGARG